MALAIVYSRASSGMDAPLVTVEVHLSNGLVKFHIVGLPETAVKESRDRVRSALVNSQFEFPIRHITVNLAPADLPKDGGRFDLPIALGILAASGQLPIEKLAQYEFTGELALSGELRGIQGVLPIAIGALRAGRQLIIPESNALEASLLRKNEIRYATHLLEVCAHLNGKTELPACTTRAPSLQDISESFNDLAEVKGQMQAKRALEIAAAGGHSLLFVGPPGTGKTMLASRLPSILPELSEDQALASAAVASISHNGFDVKQWSKVPFRAPHHSSSSVALVGGGRTPKPGEISLAHHGVLFLDELPEFSRHVLESLREPLELGSITISRAAFQVHFPAQFQLIAAMNPCPCGFAGSMLETCECSSEQIKRYLAKISGPLLERIDMHIEVPHLSPEVLVKTNAIANETSETVRWRVVQARKLQLDRQGKMNSKLTVAELEHVCQLEEPAAKFLHQVMMKLSLSARVYHRLLKVARTIADLQSKPSINDQHLSEVLSYRCLERLKRLY